MYNVTVMYNFMKFDDNQCTVDLFLSICMRWVVCTAPTTCICTLTTVTPHVIDCHCIIHSLKIPELHVSTPTATEAIFE